MMKIIREGERGVALAPGLGRVPVVFRYRTLTLDSGARIASVLVGVHEESDEVLVIPAQSAARIKEVRGTSKEEILEARVPRELEDVLAMVAEHYHVTTRRFSPALIRFYLQSATEQPPLARRLSRLARHPLAQGRLAGRIKVRCESRLTVGLERLAGVLGDASQSDLVRGAIMAAKEDVLDGRASRRAEQLEAVAAAV
ncbi:MAG TPA: hypothetical protein VLA36_03295 [Longimicrobiales bacterium]|nr:hypothetical protein [Longimicrobiales bacterium]